MAEFSKVLKADPLGDPYESHGKKIQSYWCQVEGQEKAVMIGKQVRDDGAPALQAGKHVYGDLMYAKSQKGTEYWKFKSAQVPEGVQRPADSPAQAAAQAATGGAGYGEQWAEGTGEVVPKWAVPLYNMVEYIFKEMKKMETSAEPQTEPELPPAPKPEPIDDDTKQVLDEIFGPTEDAEPPEPKDA